MPPTGDHLWAERFDRKLEDIFAVQDEVTGKIVEALAGRLTAGPARNRPASLAAYDLCVKARGLYFQNGIAAREACYLLERAIAIDPNYAEAHRWLSLNTFLASSFWDATLERQRAVSEAERAVAIDPNDAGNHWVLAIVLGHQRRFEEAEAAFEQTFRLDPNHADGWAMRSDLRVMAGRAAEAMEFVRKAFRLNPHPPGWSIGCWAKPSTSRATPKPRFRPCAIRRPIARPRVAPWQQRWRILGVLMTRGWKRSSS